MSGGDSGYDDMFNEGLFRSRVHNSALVRPNLWPDSTSEMRKHTSYTEQACGRDYSDGLFAARLRHTRQTRPDRWPQSVSEMRKHTTYAPQGMRPAPMSMQVPQAPQRRWVYLPDRQGWVLR